MVKSILLYSVRRAQRSSKLLKTKEDRFTNKKGKPQYITDIVFLKSGNEASGIGSWDWNLKGDNSTYHALFPRAWSVYEGNLH